MNHYEVLGVGSGADATQIRAAYLAAARLHHPDFHAAEPASVRSHHAQQMVLINEAWAVLRDPRSRAEYDRARRTAAFSRGSTWTPPRTERSRYPRQTPAGKGWSPRREDDGWMEDFAAWSAESDEPPPDVPRPGPVRGLLTIAPVGLFVTAVLMAVLAAAMDARPLLAAAMVALVLSVGLFLLAPMIQIVQDRRRR